MSRDRCGKLVSKQKNGSEWKRLSNMRSINLTLDPFSFVLLLVYVRTVHEIIQYEYSKLFISECKTNKGVSWVRLLGVQHRRLLPSKSQANMLHKPWLSKCSILIFYSLILNIISIIIVNYRNLQTS